MGNSAVEMGTKLWKQEGLFIGCVALSNLERVLAIIANGTGSAISWNFPAKKPVEENIQLEPFMSMCLLVLLLYSSRSAAEFQAPWFFFRIISSSFLILCPHSGLNLSPFYCKMVDMPSSLFVSENHVPQITCPSCVQNPQEVPVAHFHQPLEVLVTLLYRPLWPSPLNSPSPCPTLIPGSFLLCMPSFPLSSAQNTLCPLPRDLMESFPLWEDSSLPSNYFSQCLHIGFHLPLSSCPRDPLELLKISF